MLTDRQIPDPKPGSLHYWHWKVAFLPRAVWIGMAWKRYPKALDLMFCPLPCCGVGLYIQWH
jgi:hypothetical protein